MSFPVVYQPATKAASGPTPGAKALMAWVLANYPPGTNLGIYNPRSVRGGSALSLHAEGRALDVGFPRTQGGTSEGWKLATDMAVVSRWLGVQCVIYARKIWTNTRPTWRPYTGTADHYDHVHIELTREAAAGLTTDTIRQTMGATTVPAKPPTDLTAQWQQMLLDNGADLGPSGADGGFGRLTLAASQTILDHRNLLLRTVEQVSKANATSADTIKRLTAERDEVASENLELRALDAVARQGPAIVARIQALRAELAATEADLARIVGGGA